LPADLWADVKAKAKRRGRPIRELVHDALDAELPPVIDALRQLGLNADDQAEKLVRLPVDDNVVGRLNCGRRRTGLPAVQLLILCLARHTAADSIGPSQLRERRA
jgi:hypothetical protein